MLRYDNDSGDLFLVGKDAVQHEEDEINVNKIQDRRKIMSQHEMRKKRALTTTNISINNAPPRPLSK
jgi:hypothetical protein